MTIGIVCVNLIQHYPNIISTMLVEKIEFSHIL